MTASSIARSSETDDALRLTFCPRCDYSLQGLNDEGNCPECGTPFDKKKFVILRTRPVMVGAHPNAQKAFSSKRCWLAGGYVIAILLFIHYLNIPELWPWVLLGIGSSVSNLLLEVIVLSTAVRRGEILIWMSAEGIGQQSVLDPEAVLPKVSRLIVLVYPLVIMVWSTRMFPKYTPDWSFLIGSGIFLLLVYIAGWYSWKKAKPFAVAPAGIRPGLMPWSIYSAVHWKKLADNRYELLVCSSAFVSPPPTVHVRLDLSTAAAAALKTQLGQWTRGQAAAS